MMSFFTRLYFHKVLLKYLLLLTSELLTLPELVIASWKSLMYVFEQLKMFALKSHLLSIICFTMGVIRYSRYLAICLLTRKEIVLLCIQEYSKPCLTLAYLETREICDLRHIQNLSISKGLMVFRSLSNML